LISKTVIRNSSWHRRCAGFFAGCGNPPSLGRLQLARRRRRSS